MGQKVNPKVIRIGIINDWSSKWFVNKKKYCNFFHEDLAIRKFLLELFPHGMIASIDILRQSNKTALNIYTSKPGLIIGKSGDGIEDLKEKLKKKFSIQFSINVHEIKNSYTNAQLVGDNIAHQVERRLPYRRVVKAALAKAKEEGVKGIKVFIAGRLNGVEIARSEMFIEGTIPLHTFRADIDYALSEAKTRYGIIGIKVWIYRGDVFRKKVNINKVEEA
ncbi:MAG: 30S ribosomal protein S3, small subunit ribosomal protein S3 [Candidatus Peregrinibacteria bacterium GW2011_GWF2_33_10]|nr:MAG: 30S ribosomal protein S3, small subunit ribosomal protein S3 [Candidatus Peregrinibacteria bacterium GW2011_GWF2_33_10]OGJ46131.1 MAG: 30S ribosomal protein S3 [Candidatus Peregrinibacteria bacterium RIFOXYA12_FULL_33_12]OGJ46163.1 MAG: 30S ribosomal protein S3 [Candidatus Peregrinibacteria bacterium RIFOXYA2_FULL_33_21]OGJ51580.1 MAG: 30S ribosomal protein S3 [Candidatus Peregrinibacteria bacterium RIFOXYB2_FULL_33_20]